MEQVVIGTVGYYSFLRGYPLGPRLMERLKAVPWPSSVTLYEMNWGPIAIVQDFQASRVAYDRAVLVAAVDRGEQSGVVTCRRWLGGEPDALELQERMHEAVTGIISLDNLLVIGEHFKIWPAEVITVELQLEDRSFGDFVLDEMKERGEALRVVGEKPITPEVDAIVNRLVEFTRRAAIDGVRGMPELRPLTAGQLRPVAKVSHHRFVTVDTSPERD
jgi:hypothetical protein